MVEKVGGAYYSVNDGQRTELTALVAQFVENAHDIFLPVGGAMALSVFSAGLLRGIRAFRRQAVDGLKLEP